MSIVQLDRLLRRAMRIGCVVVWRPGYGGGSWQLCKLEALDG